MLSRSVPRNELGGRCGVGGMKREVVMAEGKCGLDADGVWRFVVHPAVLVLVLVLAGWQRSFCFPSPSVWELAPNNPLCLCAAEWPQALTILCCAPTKGQI